VGTSPGWRETMTEVADLHSGDCASGLRYLAERMRMFYELSIDSARHGKSFSGGLREEGECEGVDGELCFVGGEREGQPGRLAHRARLVQLVGKGVEVWGIGRGGGGRVGDEKGDRSTLIDLGCDREGENAVCISQDAGSNVRESRSNEGRLRALRGGRTGGVESPFGRRKCPRYLDLRGEVVG